MYLLGAANMTIVALLGLGGVIAFFAAQKWVKVDHFFDEVRSHCITLSAWCLNNGLPLLGKLLNYLAADDKLGVYHTFKEILALIANPSELALAVNRFLNVQLDNKLATAEGREELIVAIESRLNIKIDRDAINKAKTSTVLSNTLTRDSSVAGQTVAS